MRFLRSFFLPFLLILYSHVSSNYSTSLPLKTQGLLKLRAYRSITDQAGKSDSTTPTNDDIENLSFEDLQKLEKDADDKLTETKKNLSDKKSELESKKEEAKVPLQEHEEKKSKFAELDGIAKGMNKELDDAIDEYNIAKGESKIADDLFDELTDATAKVDEYTIREKYVKDAQNRQPIAKTEMDDLTNKCKPLNGQIDTLETEVNRKNDTVIAARKEVEKQQRRVDRCKSNCEDKEKTLKDSKDSLEAAESELDKAVKKLDLSIECPDKVKKITAEVDDLNTIMIDHAKAVADAQKNLAASIELSKDPKFDGIEDRKTAANKKMQQKKEAKEAAEAKAKTPEEVEAAEDAAGDAKLEFGDATNTKNRLEGEIRDISNTIVILQKRVVSEEARVEKLRKVLEKKSEKPAKSASWLIFVYVFAVLAVVATVAFVIVKWGLPRLKLAKNARNGTQSAAKDSAAVPASETAGSKQSEVSHKQPEGDVQPQVPVANTISPTPTPLSASQTPTKLETAAKLATYLETAAQTHSLVESATQTQSIVESATQTFTESAARTPSMHECTTQTATTAAQASPAKPHPGENKPEELTVDELPEGTKWQKELKNNVKGHLAKGHAAFITRQGKDTPRGGIMYQIEDKDGQEIESYRYFNDGHGSYVQNPKYFKEGVIDFIRKFMEITKTPYPYKAVKYARVTYVAALTTIYLITEYFRKKAQQRAEDKAREKVELDRQKPLTDRERAEHEKDEPEEGENTNSERSKRSRHDRARKKKTSRHEKSDEDDKNSEKSDDKSKSSKKETRIRIANKKRKSKKTSKTKGKDQTKGRKKHSNKRNKNSDSESTSEEDPYLTKVHHSKRRQNGKTNKKSNGKKKADDFEYPSMKELKKRFEEAPATEVDDATLFKILLDLIKSIEDGTTYTMDPEVKMYILKRQQKHFEKQPVYIELGDGRVNVVGDLHGNGDNMLHIFSKYHGIESEEFKKQHFIFLGDLVDRGRHSEEVFLVVGLLQLLMPTQYTILRGNHETITASTVYGFKHELQTKLGLVEGAKLHEFYCYVFSFMPLCCTSNGLYFSHGGFPRLKDLPNRKLSDLNELIKKPLLDVRMNRIACGIAWDDPITGIKGYRKSSRGIGHEYGGDVLREFLFVVGLDGVVRGHQKVQNGVEFFEKWLCCTLFSSTSYDGGVRPNDGAFMLIDENKAVSFHILTPNKNITMAKLVQLRNLFFTMLHVQRASEEYERKQDYVIKDESETVERSRTEPKPVPRKSIKHSGGEQKNQKPDVKGASPKPEKKHWCNDQKRGLTDSPYADPISHITTKSGREVSQHSK